MRWARSPISTLNARGSRSGSPKGSTRCFSPSGRRSQVRAGRPRFRREAQRQRPPLSLSHGQPPRAARARSRTRLAGEASPRRRRDARSRPVAGRPARFLDLPRLPMPGEFAIRTLDRLDVIRDGDEVQVQAARCRSCTGRCAGSSARWSRSAWAVRAPATSRPRSKPPTAAVRPGRPGLRPLSRQGRLSERAARSTVGPYPPPRKQGRGPREARGRGLAIRCERRRNHRQRPPHSARALVTGSAPVEQMASACP